MPMLPQGRPNAPPVGNDGLAAKTTLVSTSGGNSSISTDGNYVTFSSLSDFSGPTSPGSDVYLKNLLTGALALVSTASNGSPGNGDSQLPTVSAGGRFVLFESLATNLVGADRNGFIDVFRKDLLTGETLLVSVAGDGTQGNGDSGAGAMSANGQLVALYTQATNWVSGDTNGCWDVYVKNLLSGELTLVSAAVGGGTGNGLSEAPIISGSGRHVAFYSYADNLVAGDRNGVADVYVRNLQTDELHLVSSSADGMAGNGDSYSSSISENGRYVAFYSIAGNLTVGSDNNHWDAFVKDLSTGHITLASAGLNGAPANGGSFDPKLSADGRYVVFASDASNLVAGDNNGMTDVFVRDLQTGTIGLVSVGLDGAPGNGGSHNTSTYGTSISASGNSIVFSSSATNLVAGDPNGAESDVFLRVFGPPGDPLFG